MARTGPTSLILPGLDIDKHGEEAYPVQAYGHGWVTNTPINHNGHLPKHSGNRVDLEMKKYENDYSHPCHESMAIRNRLAIRSGGSSADEAQNHNGVLAVTDH